MIHRTKGISISMQKLGNGLSPLDPQLDGIGHAVELSLENTLILIGSYPVDGILEQFRKSLTSGG